MMTEGMYDFKYVSVDDIVVFRERRFLWEGFFVWSKGKF